jgi:hypothetical protein
LRCSRSPLAHPRWYRRRSPAGNRPMGACRRPPHHHRRWPRL